MATTIYYKKESVTELIPFCVTNGNPQFAVNLIHHTTKEKFNALYFAKIDRFVSLSEALKDSTFESLLSKAKELVIIHSLGYIDEACTIPAYKADAAGKPTNQQIECWTLANTGWRTLDFASLA